MSVYTAKILQLPTKRAWAQIYTSPESEDTQTRENLIAVLAFENPEEQTPNAIEIGHEVLERLSEGYFKSQGTAYERFKKAVTAQCGEPYKGRKIKICACLIWNQYLYLGISRETQIWVKKENNVFKIRAAEDENFFSQEIKETENLLLGTSEFFSNIGEEKINSIFSGGATPQEIADNLGPLVHTTDNPLVAAALVTVKPFAGIMPSPQVVVPTLNSAEQTIRKNPLKSLLIKFAQVLPENQYQPTRRGASKRTALAVGTVLILILLVSIFLGVRQKGLNRYKASYGERLTSAQELYAGALSQKDIDTSRARELFTEAKGLVEALRTEGIKDSKLDALEGQMKENEGAILGKVALAPTLFLDLSLVRSGIEASKFVLEKEKLAVLDSVGERIILVGVAGKDTSVVGGPDKTPKPQTLALYEERIYVLTEKGVVEIDKRGNVKTVIEKDTEWGNIAQMGVFGGNIYLLSAEGVIWRYPAVSTGSGFGPKQSWLAEGITPNFTNTQDMAIDGSVWVLSENGQVQKFTRGAPDNFRVSGFGESLAKSISLHAEEGEDSIFILDQERGNIAETDKVGNYKMEYTADQTKQAEDMVVSVPSGKIFLLVGNQILEAPLKN